TIAGMARAFDALLGAALSYPDRPLRLLPLLTPDERERLIRAGSETVPSAAGMPSTLCEMFAAQVARTPNATALIGENASLSFAELMDRVDGLAIRLRRFGVGPGVRVGVCLSRSPQMIVGLLAVLRLGGAYVPLDPDYPQDRLAYMALDAGLVL